MTTVLFAPRQKTSALDSEAADAVSTLLRFIGEDPSRDGLVDTAERVVRAWRGTRQPATQMVTSSMLGTLRDDAVSRSEFLRLCESNN